MSLMLNLKSVKDTELWKHLKNGFEETSDKELAHKISDNLSELCDEASSRMKLIPTLHPEFTLHDQTHLICVTELMAKILGRSLRSLNPVDIMLLILSAYYHDQGMVLEGKDF
jgi:HD-GYP domain-containing protein (c-di-GMP phosphodiesterase class II)